MVTNKKELFLQLAAHSEQIKQYGVSDIGVFGSFNEDKAKPESDVDILVNFYNGQKSFDNFMDLNFFLENLLGRKVELVTPQSLNKHIAPYILQSTNYVAL